MVWLVWEFVALHFGLVSPQASFFLPSLYMSVHVVLSTGSFDAPMQSVVHASTRQLVMGSLPTWLVDVDSSGQVGWCTRGNTGNQSSQ
ncbi:uncharacterized protein BKA78DRAFT_323088 [Phyllosticta capitalensis]|uniref:uncharacterized protein n=1 Tax=Phyllosticta capitalensis TaxID=121624 RepID=UPI00312EEB9C